MKKLSTKDDVETLLVKVTGKVQGVGFRFSTVRQAHSCGVVGWVRNLDDGAVEALLQGPHSSIDQLLSWLHIGPPAARVNEVTITEVQDERRYDRFEQL
jgi:Acylphosphatases